MIREGALALPAGRRRWRFGELLQALGDLLQRRQDVIRRIQWSFVAVYLALLVIPALLPADAGPFRHLAKIAEALFWGLWWPGVILSMLVFGQFWCGLLCPDGTLTEFASRHGRGKKIPAWLRWAGWPLLLFAIITVWEHLIDAFRSPLPTLLLVGGTTLLATVTGFFIARGKRVWCRYLCPGSSIFSLLARAAIFHYRVDRSAWDAAPKPLPRAVDCPPLLDVRRLRSNEKCNMCGRCSGHRNAVALSARAPGAEIAGMEEGEARIWEALAICFVLIGLCHAVIGWQESALYHWLLNAFAQQALLSSLAAGTLPALLTMLLTTLALGTAVALLLLAGAGGRVQRAALMAYSLIPLAGMGIFLGALEHGYSLLAEAGIDTAEAAWLVRIVAVSLSFIWSLTLARILIKRIEQRPGARYAATTFQVLAMGLMATMYIW